MSHYDEVLKEARAKATGSAAIYIPKLFKILVDEDKHTPEEARAIIEHDLISYWARTTIRKNLPEEAKDEIKAKAGKEGAKATNLVLAGGQTQTQTETVTMPADDKIPADRPPFDPDEEIKKIGEIRRDLAKKDAEEDDAKDLEIQFLKERVAELEDALKKTEQFKPATQLQEAKDPTPELQLTDDLVFQYLRDRAKETGNILIIDRVGAGALVQALAQYKTAFGVAELFLRIIK